MGVQKKGKRDKNYTVEEKSFIGSLCIPKSGRISCCEGKESEGWIRPAQQSAYLLVRGRKRRRQEALISPGEKSIPKLFSLTAPSFPSSYSTRMKLFGLWGKKLEFRRNVLKDTAQYAVTFIPHFTYPRPCAPCLLSTLQLSKLRCCIPAPLRILQWRKKRNPTRRNLEFCLRRGLRFHGRESNFEFRKKKKNPRSGNWVHAGGGKAGLAQQFALCLVWEWRQ